MTISEVSPEKLKGDEHQQTPWFKGEHGDLFIIFEKRKILHFEVTFENRHLEGGHARSLKYGLVDSNRDAEDIEDVLSFKKSRIVNYINAVPKDFVDQAIDLVHHSNNLERVIAEGLMKYLSSLGKDDTGFFVDEDFESFRAIVPKKRDYKTILWKNRNLIILSLFFILVLKLSYNFLWRGDLRTSCRDGSDLACANVGIIELISGSKKPTALWIKSKSKSIEKDKQKCIDGNMDLCYELYDNKKIHHRKYQEIEVLDKRSCLDYKHPRGCYYLGILAFQKNQRMKGIEYLSISCKEQFKDSCLLIESEISYLKNKEACRQLNSEACYFVGMKELRDGETEKALLSLDIACQNKIIAACLETGISYASSGKIKEAKQSFRSACLLNDYKGCFNLKFLLAKTISEKKSIRKKYQFCRDNIESACSFLRKID